MVAGNARPAKAERCEQWRSKPQGKEHPSGWIPGEIREWNGQILTGKQEQNENPVTCGKFV